MKRKDVERIEEDAQDLERREQRQARTIASPTMTRPSTRRDSLDNQLTEPGLCVQQEAWSPVALVDRRSSAASSSCVAPAAAGAVGGLVGGGGAPGSSGADGESSRGTMARC